MSERMDCEACRERLESYIVGDLASAEQPAVAEHLKGCESCAKAYERTRRVVSAMKDAKESFAPKERFVPAETRARAGRPPMRGLWGWRAAAAAGLALALVSTSALVVPAFAEQLGILPVSRELDELRTERDALRQTATELRSEVEQLRIELKEIEGVSVPEVRSSAEELPPEVNDQVQSLVIRFIRAQYDRDEAALREMGTDTLDEMLSKRPGDYLKKGGTVTFAQITNVGMAEDGTYVVFVRLSDAEFDDSQYQENFGVRKVGDVFLVEYVEMDA